MPLDISYVTSDRVHRYRQTVFYTPDTLTVSAGENITGELTCAPNARNPRDLDIAIEYKTPSDQELATVQFKMCATFYCFYRSYDRSIWANANEVSGLDEHYRSILSCTPCFLSARCISFERLCPQVLTIRSDVITGVKCTLIEGKWVKYTHGQDWSIYLEVVFSIHRTL